MVVRSMRVSFIGLGVFVLLACGAGGLLYRYSLTNTFPLPGVRIAGIPLKNGNLNFVIQTISQQPISLRFGEQQLTVNPSELGVRVDGPAIEALVSRLGRSGNFWLDLSVRAHAHVGGLDIPPILSLDRRIALEFFAQLKRRLDREAIEPRINFDTGRVIRARAGRTLSLINGLAALNAALREGIRVIDLPIDVQKPQHAERYENLDVSHVLGQFETVYSLADDAADRAHNLNVGAARLDGYVLAPGALFSYNAVVGPRDASQGYRTAPVISRGEIVDGMAGGSCQLSSTLFAAAFFAGLDLVSSRPHTIPSSYIKMGLDAAVAFPSTDLVIRNPYPFPIAISFRVARGRVTAAIHGKQRPWRRIVFEREIKRTHPFEELIRDDPSLPRGVRVVAQGGIPGFLLERRRLFYGSENNPTKIERRELRYPPTAQIVRLGTGKADPEFSPPKARKPFGPAKEHYRLAQ